MYGTDRLLEAKRGERALLDAKWPTDDVIREREELAEQMRALADLATMAEELWFRHHAPGSNAREAVQWTYFGYLGAIKEANGAAMSIGRISSFLDIYIERDLKRGDLDESRRSGTHRPARSETPHRSLPAHARNMTRSSRATPTGRRNVSAAWISTVDRW